MLASASASDLFHGVYQGKTVLVTGHTGFKGSWLAMWLLRMGARVVGYSLEPPTKPSLFERAKLAEHLQHHVGDVCDGAALEAVMRATRPEVVFHLAAQPLVRLSYAEPVQTFATNVLGTVNLLEATRKVDSVRACVVVTSDKCYENREWVYAYRENDAMGGFDPYSASKGCAELVVSSYRSSFFSSSGSPVMALGSARAGNVIGGGDWALDRIVPDCIRALQQQEPILVRNPAAIRPWQHVLEPLSGYLLLGEKLLTEPARHAEAWNFGPNGSSNVPVRDVVERVVFHWGSGRWSTPATSAQQPHEAKFLKLDITKAVNLLHWEPVYTLDDALEATVAWYAAHHREGAFDALDFSQQQIAEYAKQAARKGMSWALGASEAR